MACTKEKVKPTGLNVWSRGPEAGHVPVVDIIAVQGLGSHPYYTWVKKGQSSKASERQRFRDKAKFWKNKERQDKEQDGPAECMWIRDLLVPLFEDARIATYSYKSDWKDRNVKTNLRECAEQFLNTLHQHRQDKSALVLAVHQQDFTNIRLSVAGIIFLGAPFQGSDVATYGTWLARIADLDTALLEMLRKGSPDLHGISSDFYGSYNQWDVVCFYEKENSYMQTKVVNQQSARLLGKRAMFLETDHSGLNKFSGADDENFILVRSEIQRMVEDGPSSIIERYRINGIAETELYLHWRVPRVVNELFTGREELLDRIQKALRYDNNSFVKKQKRFVITGLGGQGKSEICLKIASLMQKEFWGVFWVNLDSPSTAENDFIAIANDLGHPVEHLAEALKVLANIRRSWLLILDNADDPKVDYQCYFPSGNNGAVMMTSRIPECRRYSPDASEALEGLDDEASDLLFKAAAIPPELWAPNYNSANEVVRCLGSHTLALIQAGAYIAKGHCQLHEYPGVFHRQRLRLLRYGPQQARSRYSDVFTTFEVSADILEQSEDETARDALHLLEIFSMVASSILPLRIFEAAWYEGKDIAYNNSTASSIDDLSQSHVSQLPSFMVIDGDEWDDYRLLEASSLLVSLSLITRHNQNDVPGISMHPLIHAWAKDRQSLKQQETVWMGTGCVLAFSQSDSEMWRTHARLLLPHIQSFLDIEVYTTLLIDSESIVLPILLNCGWALRDMRQDSRLGQLLERIFSKLRINPQKLCEDYLLLYKIQTENLYNLGKIKDTVLLQEQVVKIESVTLPKDHPDRLASQYELAKAYKANGQVKEAITLLEHVVKIQDAILAEDHPQRLASQHVLAMVYEANGQVKEAVTLLERVVQIESVTLAEDHPDRLASQHELAIAYEANGQVKEAITLLQRVVQIKSVTLAEDHPNRLASQHVLAMAYKANGQVKEAVTLLEHVVKIRDAKLAEDHPDRLASQHELARAYEANGQVKEAITLLQRVVQIESVTLAEDHPDRLASQHELAIAYKANGQVKEAITLLEQVVKIQDAILAEDHPQRLASQYVLAMAYEANGQVKEAVTLLERVVQIESVTLAEDHPNRLASQHELARAYKANGQVKEAVTLLEQVVKIQDAKLAEDHPQRLASQHVLARAYIANGQVKEAITLLEQVVKIQDAKLAEDYPQRLAS
ncbi:putative kinesin light chain 1 protein [Coleophoma crateriformis]|uniref:Putative kinesin light chain 1 protein n=1 Tax=Coleophoma crateriformis TaxID=565419 RepID=A0A3D8SAU4_9HELO|nr:putative kinesin light chain 1 protein [Coleophoma crateriformis]